jgi:hypothetical protein
MQPQKWLPFSQQHVTGSYPVPDEPVHALMSYFFKIQFILPPMPRLSELVQWSRSALSMGPNWVGVFILTWGRKQIQFPKRRVF